MATNWSTFAKHQPNMTKHHRLNHSKTTAKSPNLHKPNTITIHKNPQKRRPSDKVKRIKPRQSSKHFNHLPQPFSLPGFQRTPRIFTFITWVKTTFSKAVVPWKHPCFFWALGFSMEFGVLKNDRFFDGFLLLRGCSRAVLWGFMGVLEVSNGVSMSFYGCSMA